MKNVLFVNKNESEFLIRFMFLTGIFQNFLFFDNWLIFHFEVTYSTHSFLGKSLTSSISQNLKQVLEYYTKSIIQTGGIKVLSDKMC